MATADKASTHSSGLTLSSPLATRLMAWAAERFPPINAILAGVIAFAALLYGRSLAVPSLFPLPLTPRDFLAIPAVIGFFLLLRVLDEHKDFELDCQNHPNRILQSGLISLRHLKVVGAIAVAIQLFATAALARSGSVLWVAFGAMIGWSLLMAKEFFIGEWLKKRLFLYALSHMLVMPMALLWMAQMGAPHQRLPLRALELAAMGFFSGFVLEIGRKTKAPEGEQEGVDSYTKVFGLRGAPLVVVLLSAVQTVLLEIALKTAHGKALPIWLLLLPPLFFLLPLGSAISFLRGPNSKSAKGVEAGAGLLLLLSYGLLLTAVLVGRKILWLSL